MFKNKKLNSFHQSLNKFGEKIDKLEYSLKNANETINEECRELQRKVQGLKFHYVNHIQLKFPEFLPRNFIDAFLTLYSECLYCICKGHLTVRVDLLTPYLLAIRLHTRHLRI